MTVVPAENQMSMICDGCGDTVTGTANVLPDAEVVWTLVFDNGWTGSAFASGPHHCPRCSLSPQLSGSQSHLRNPLGIDDLDEHEDRPVAEVDVAESVRRALSEALTLSPHVLVDLSEVATIDSVGLGLLVRALQEARQEGRALCLVAPSRFVLTVLHTMRLEHVFPVFATRTAAFQHCTRAVGAQTRPAPLAPTTEAAR
ncbi:anti-anti-sigma factor [Micromonospora sp. A200]|uniref:STAS domain-containing protein n=1 Tax=Micromonospora sp. A200 TaxID=2940568 RepID=UPI0024738423|nr:STAS domain-containing protein [Micromonospora sp. A200]MDH6462699.1 anti-anti-sigma factor [Micromonospora sp. A200]